MDLFTTNDYNHMIIGFSFSSAKMSFIYAKQTPLVFWKFLSLFSQYSNFCCPPFIHTHTEIEKTFLPERDWASAQFNSVGEKQEKFFATLFWIHITFAKYVFLFFVCLFVWSSFFFVDDIFFI